MRQAGTAPAASDCSRSSPPAAAATTTRPPAPGDRDRRAAARGADACCAREPRARRTTASSRVGTDNPAFPPWFDGGTTGRAGVEDQRPVDRQGLRERRRLRGRREARLREGRGAVDRRPVQQLVRPGPKNFDFDINQISVTPTSAKAVDFSDSYYDVNQALVGLNGHADRRRDVDRRPEGRASSAPRSGRRARLHRRTRSSRRQGAARLRHLERRRRGAQEGSRSTASSSTCRPRSSSSARGGQERQDRRPVPADRRAGALRDALRRRATRSSTA